MNRPTAARGTFPYPHRTIAEVEADALAKLNREAGVIIAGLDRRTAVKVLYACGHSCREIADHFAVAPNSVREMLKRAGVKMRPQGSLGLGPVRARAA